MSTEELQRRLMVELSELAQNLMLVGYESSSSRISHENGDMTFRGFSGTVVITKQGELLVSDKGQLLFRTKRAQGGVDESLIQRLKRLNKELLDIYEQQVLSGD